MNATNLKERILFLVLELVGTEEAETAVGLLIVEAFLRNLQESENVLDDDGF